MNRAEVLEAANGLINGERAEAYGDFGEQMTDVAMMFNAMRSGDDRDFRLLPSDVAKILMCLKMHRSETSNAADDYVDLCGYAALTCEYFGKGGS